MKKSFRITAAGCLGLLAIAGSCSRSQEAVQPRRVAIAPAITRVTDLNFETDDRIGLTIVRASGNYVENEPMTYDGTFFVSPDLTWYGESDERATLLAYYPYQPDGLASGFSVTADQSEGTEASDLLGAIREEVAPTSSAVGMVFRHLLSSVRIVVTNETASPVTELKLCGTVLEAEVDLRTQTVTVRSGASAQDIRTFAVNENQSYEAVIVPQSAALRLTVTTADGRTRSTDFGANAFLQGKYYTISLVVGEEMLRPTLSGEVADWETGGNLNTDGTDTGSSGDEEGSDSSAEEGTMLCMGESYPTVELGGRIWMAENLHYVPDDSMEGCWYPNGEMDLLSDYGMLYDIASAERFCPEGWRLPTEEDFEALVAVLEEPYEAFVPLAGIYARSQTQYRYFGIRGNLAGSTQGEVSSLRRCLQLSGVGQTSLSIQDGQISNGMSVRYVRDAE